MMQFQIEDMSCEGCVKGITRAIARVDPQAEVSADLSAKTVDIISQMPREAFLPAIEDAGFTVSG
ncbi:heavy-metal-associated domain-containing protein [Aquamicrobium sp. cd-1]|uniref:Heavy-metal-associated domain-containing protein n=2 Tax=Aquamicrobium zhengzhouense TaxID=2781738 RepID=A0ABS0S8S7_9HYPH|nr:heavy-metal-associated domain-containing protein [Aquamicrobium zhengzhouense]